MYRCKVDLWKQFCPEAIWCIFEEHDLNLASMEKLPNTSIFLFLYWTIVSNLHLLRMK